MDQLRPPLVARLRPAHWAAIDGACAVALALAYRFVFKEPAPVRGIPQWAGAVTVALAVLPAAFRRRWPRAVLTLVVTCGAVMTAISVEPAPQLAGAFVMYLIPLRCPPRQARWLGGGALAVTAAGFAGFGAVPHAGYGAPDIASQLAAAVLMITAAWMIGYSVRQQRAYAAGLREQAEQRAREQLAEAHRASSEERLQIARELHDVLAHTMSVIAVQSGVANYVVGERPDEAARALSSIEETSRDGLHELRALLGVLRAPGNGTSARRQQAGLLPAPGLADLGRLAERTAEAGVRVDIDVRGDQARLPAGLDLAAYRVIQEAVTNVIKHAETDRCRVTVTHEPRALVLQVTDSGAGSRRGGGQGPAGNGIAGMRERAAMYGGHLRAGPLPGRGFQVTARLPLTGTAP
jgi:signal transduction histidine kinase